MIELDIAQVVKRTGLKPSTLRFYEDKGLIRSIGRRGLRRQYGEEVLQKLALINLGRQAGLTLAEIGAMFDERGEMHIDRQHLLTKAEEVDNTIRRLKAVRDGLRHVAQCPADHHLACPTFQKMLDMLLK
ncbi:helix-turn-helix domain-containing protein [Serratia sp. NPDC078593]|uniref:helix-turn-helix domain-containing protein n=1 Tax=unclassified Serratia (in: enterobacteria) TaxID=2647522 RepID=UPI0037D15F0B